MQNSLKIKRTKTALAFNLAIIACEIAAIIIVFFKIGCYPLIYYTEDSNLFALVACAVMAGFQVRYLKSGKEIPHSVQMFKYMAAAVLSVTFIVVLAVLSPMRGDGINGWLYMLFSILHQLVVFHKNHSNLKFSSVYCLIIYYFLFLPVELSF